MAILIEHGDIGLAEADHRIANNLTSLSGAVRLQRGLVFVADTRTNAGVDYVLTIQKAVFLAGLGFAFSCCLLPET